jgi:DNA-binding NarL/FixJ family response regulator
MSRGRVLVIDDCELVASAMELLLEEAGFAVKTTTCPITLPALLRQFRPHAVLLDLAMPALSGAGVLSIAQRQDLFAGAAVILFSGMGERDLAEQTESLEVNGYLHKSDESEKIIRHVGFWVDWARQMRLERAGIERIRVALPPRRHGFALEQTS